MVLWQMLEYAQGYYCIFSVLKCSYTCKYKVECYDFDLLKKMYGWSQFGFMHTHKMLKYVISL